MSDRAPKVQRPGRVGSKFLLSGLLKCGVCGRPYSAQGAKSGQFAYYICGTLFREGAGTCSARYLNAPRLETFVVEKIRERILNEETIVALVTLVAEEIDAMAGELSGRLEVVQAELGDVRKRLEKLYEAIETSELTLEVLSPRIMSLRHREEQLEAARDDAETQLEQRRVELPNTEEIARYVADFRDFLKDGTIPERKALIRNFVEGIEVEGDEATLTYTVPMPSDGAMSESASVLDFVKSSPPTCTEFITRPVQGDLCSVRSPHRRVIRRGYGVDDGGSAGLDLDLLDEGVDEGPGLGQLAGLEEVAHLGCEGGDGVGAVQHHPPLLQQPSRLLCGDLQLLLALPVLPDALRGVGHLDVGGLDDLPDAAQPLLHVPQAPRRWSEAAPSAPAPRRPSPRPAASPGLGWLDSVRTFSLISPTMSCSKDLALSLGESQAPLPRFIRDWQT